MFMPKRIYRDFTVEIIGRQKFVGLIEMLGLLLVWVWIGWHFIMTILNIERRLLDFSFQIK